MNACWVLTSGRDGERERNQIGKSGHRRPKDRAQRQSRTSSLGPEQVVILDNEKQGKSPGWFLKLLVHPKAVQSKLHVKKAGLLSIQSIPEPIPPALLILHEAAC